MHPDKKATGWKIPLLFCAVLMAMIAVGALFREEKPRAPALPEALLEKARQTRIDLEKAGLGEWREKIRASASGFQDNAIKDAKLAQVAEEALAEDLPEAASAAVIHIKAEEARERVLEKILAFGLDSCERLEWAVFATHASSSQKNMDRRARMIQEKWRNCGQGR